MADLRVLAWPAFSNRAINPYTWLLYTEVAKLGVLVDELSPAALAPVRPYDIWHIHWPERVFSGSRLARSILKTAAVEASLSLARARGTRIVWTVHNLASHDPAYPRLEQAFWRRFVAGVDGVISLSEIGLKLVREKHPRLATVPAAVIPHGHYRNGYPDSVNRIGARSALGIDPRARVLLYVGQIRSYKGVPALIHAFKGLEDPANVLLVAGDPRSASERGAVVAASAPDGRVRLSLNFVADEALQYYLRAADLVVLPYVETLNSGSALLALSFDCPVLVPGVGALHELAMAIGPDWVRTYTGALTTSTLDAALDWAAVLRTCRAPLDHLCWSTIATRTVELYRAALAS